MSRTQSANTQTAYQHHSRSFAEWVTFSIAVTIGLGVAGLIVYDWFSGSTEPPMLHVVQQGVVEQVGDQFRVPFTLTNDGGETAEAVQVIAELRQNGEVAEDGEQLIDFLSGGESEEGAFLFTADPRQAELSIRVASYKIP